MKLSKTQIEQAAKAAIKQEQKDNLKKGIPNVYCIKGKIVYELPDGTITDKEPAYPKK